ncbi:hypothetical protein V6N13_030984 [Hibiscus sabdariffa]|uniref:Uncharacterized protein n=1 Tax=Hibiscus sabdariffa TaxID=183260 RepID=A0ABR2CLQ1_9ROSI
MAIPGATTSPKDPSFATTRPTRKAPKPKPSPSKLPALHNETKGMLVSLFDQERSFTRGVVDPMVLVSPGHDEEMRRERVEEEEENRESSGVALVEEEKWRFQAEILRAECNLLRMERDIAVKKMERRRVEMERTLKSAVQTLGRNNICEGNNVRLVLEEQIDELSEKLEKLQKRTRVKDFEVKKCRNLDEQVCVLQRQIEKFGGFSEEEICVKEIREMAEASLSTKTSSDGDESLVSNRDNNEKMSHEARVCPGHCKAIVQRLVEQVHAETEQWSQMQDMLGQVRDEMEELQKCRDFWEDRALDSEKQLQSLQSAVKEWKQKATSSEAKANELQARISTLHEEVEELRNERDRKPVRARNTSPINQEAQDETEKRVIVCRSKENRCANDNGFKVQTCTAAGLLRRRSPLREIGNLSALMKQHGEGILPLFCLPKDQEMKRSF